MQDKDTQIEQKAELQVMTKENTESPDKIETTEKLNKPSNKNNFLLICLIGSIAGILVQNYNFAMQKITENNSTPKCLEETNSKPKYWVYSAKNDVENKNGLLKHVHIVLNRLNLEKSTNQTNWSLLWSHDYPFRVLYPNLHRLKRHQKVNHFPGTGFITNKVDLATSDSKYIPKAFKLPENKEDFLKYAETNKNAKFLEKDNQHRGVILKNISDISLDDGSKFVQEYVQKPFLVDGHKFDIGVYVVLTSVDPIRAYWYKGDILFRYCPEKYYPFDAKNLDKYVIGDDYLPTWEVPSLAHPYTALGFGMKESFDIYVKSQGKDPSNIWNEVQKAIAEVLETKEHHIVSSLKNYPSKDNFFEMMRFDLVLDEDLKVYLLEANMSPNLSSAHYPPNQLLYEQVLYSLFSVTGVSTMTSPDLDSGEKTRYQAMISSQKNIATWGSHCSTTCRDVCDADLVCVTCRQCLKGDLRNSLLKAHSEHLHRGDFRRLIPPSMKPKTPLNEEFLASLSPANRLQYIWYQGKCNDDDTWCT